MSRICQQPQQTEPMQELLSIMPIRWSYKSSLIPWKRTVDNSLMSSFCPVFISDQYLTLEPHGCCLKIDDRSIKNLVSSNIDLLTSHTHKSSSPVRSN